MKFIFFNAAGTPLFIRTDAESAVWTVEDMSLVAAFPYISNKVILRGMRIGFEDESGILQPFEIRKVETMEPDHYQRITAEHIAISELTDCHMTAKELSNVTAQSALSGILSGTGWEVGTVADSSISSGDLGLGSVWQAVRSIEANWNVYITPRVVFNTSGITAKYLDISPATGTWRGIRLSLDKNTDDVGVVIDDTDTKTALFGYGKATDGVPLTFEHVVWSKTDHHPAKPAGQKYLEDTVATADYGRNGKARFGFYQNTDITDPNILLQKTWEALRATNVPRVTVDCMVRDLHRLGYADQPLRLHDIALVQIRQTNTNLQLEIIKLSVDLLDPTATRPTMGAYIPNIVYIQRETERYATGDAASTVSGRRGGGGSGGKTAQENKLSEFETEILANQYQISLRAYQRDMDNVDEILRQAGIGIDANGVLIYADDNENMLGSRFKVQSDRITAEVTRATAAEGQMSTRITQTATDITTLAQKTGVAGLAENETLFSRITQNAESITAEVGRATGAEERIGSRIQQTENSISAAVGRITTLEGDIETIEGTGLWMNRDSITQVAGKFTVSGDTVRLADGASFQVKKDGVYSTVGTVREVADAKKAGTDAMTTAEDAKSKADLIIGSGLYQNRDNITAVAGKFIVDDNGDVHVMSGSNLYLGTGSASLAVYKAGDITAGFIVDRINEGTSTIQGNHVNINANTAFTSLVGTVNGNNTSIEQLQDSLTLKVSAGDISSTINQTAQGVLINASKINLEGYTSLERFNAAVSGYSTSFTTVDLYPTNTYCGNTYTTTLYLNSQEATWKSQYVVTGINVEKAGVPGVGQMVQDVSRTGTTIYYLGRSA